MNKRSQLEKLRKTKIGIALEKAYLSVRFRREKALYNGDTISKGSHPSIIHFSVNKAATQHVKEVLQSLLKSVLVPIDLNDYAFHSERPFLDHLSPDEMKSYNYLFKPEGYLYSVFGGFVHLETLGKFQVILMVRDPRDILVSDYFSIKNSHPEPSVHGNKNPDFLNRRLKSRQQTIDEFVLEESDGYKTRFETYLNHLPKSPNLLVLRYEDMISNYPDWLQQIISFTRIKPSGETVDELVAKGNKTTSSENQSSHYRKGVQGDFVEKLSPETIKTLNSKFSGILTHFGYE